MNYIGNLIVGLGAGIGAACSPIDNDPYPLNLLFGTSAGTAFGFFTNVTLEKTVLLSPTIRIHHLGSRPLANSLAIGSLFIGNLIYACRELHEIYQRDRLTITDLKRDVQRLDECKTNPQIDIASLKANMMLIKDANQERGDDIKDISKRVKVLENLLTGKEGTYIVAYHAVPPEVNDSEQ